MQEVDETAASHWEIDRQTTGNVLKSYCLVILRNKKRASESYVRASSTDFESMEAFANVMKKDLEELSNEEFVDKYVLGSGT